jgi:hypothetical protein
MRYDNFKLVLGKHNISCLSGVIPLLIIVHPESNFNGKNIDIGK